MVNHNDDTSHHPDAHGQAAMLLVESLIHGLVAKTVLSAAEAVDIVDTAISVQEDAIIEFDAPNLLHQKSLYILQNISRSLAHDVGKK